MEILKKATGIAEAELEWKLESADGNAFLIAEERKEKHELEYSKLMFEQSKLEKLSYLLKNPNISRALTSAGKAVTSDRMAGNVDLGDRASVAPASVADSIKGKANLMSKMGIPGGKSPFGGGGNPFAAAAAAKGLGGGGLPGGGGGGGGGGGAPAGFLSQLTGGTRTALKAKAITVESAREKLVKLVKGEKSQVDKIPIKLADFNVVVEALEAVINASDDQFANVAKAKLEELKQQDKEVSDTTTATTTATTNNNNNNNNN